MDKAIKIFVDVCMIIAIISLILGIISRILVTPFPFGKAHGIEAQAYLRFTQTLLLFAIAGGIRQLWRK
jgi:small-conductance mechanosensitive channel